MTLLLLVFTIIKDKIGQSQAHLFSDMLSSQYITHCFPLLCGFHYVMLSRLCYWTHTAYRLHTAPRRHWLVVKNWYDVYYFWNSCLARFPWSIVKLPYKVRPFLHVVPSLFLSLSPPIAISQLYKTNYKRVHCYGREDREWHEGNNGSRCVCKQANITVICMRSIFTSFPMIAVSQSFQG